MSGQRRRASLRPRRTAVVLGFLIGASSLAQAAAGDFNPEGRQRRSRPPPKAQPAQAPRAAPPKRSDAAVSPPPRPDTDAAPNVLIERYLAILERDPGAEFPLERLAQLYRQRDGNLDALIAHFETRAQAPDAAGRRARVSLAGVYLHAGAPAKAEALYERALAEDPRDEVAARKLAQLLAERGDHRGARARLEPTLKLPLGEAVREQTLRSLILWSLELSDLASARKYHTELVRKAGGSFFVQAELGRMLMERRAFTEAEAEYRKLVQAARGDNRTLVPALRDLAKALLASAKPDEAIEVLSEAERHASRESGLRLELLQLLVDAHRAAERLPELVTRLEKQGARDVDQLTLLGGLYEETGRMDRARQTYEAALRQKPDSVEVRLKVVQLLELAGELDKVIEHYQRLTKSAPQNPQYAFRLAGAHLQRGEQKEALAVLTELEARSRKDEDTLAALVDFYERVGESGRALELLERLARGDGPRHLVELGDRYFARGETDKALAIWQRLGKNPNDAEALHTLGEVYLDHDLPDQALEALSRAMKLAPERPEFAKSYALGLERAGAGAPSASARARYYREAQQLWEQLLGRAVSRGDAHMSREARQHIVTLWGLMGTLAERTAPLAKKLAQNPPDLEAGRLLAEAELRLRRNEAAEKTLRTIISHAPGDVDSHVRLERALVQQGRVDDAIAVLEKLCEIDPPRAKEYYQRMATHAAQSYQDDRAVRYAARAVELGPDDAEGHQRLGEMYRERQDAEHAIAEFRHALRKNDRLFAVHFQLAELLINRQEVDEADQLLRHVIRSCPDEQLISRAARLSMQIHLGKGTLESLEKELLPMALSHPNRSVYRRLLVEIYGALAFPLAGQAKSAGKQGEEAEAALVRLGQRAVKPLLDALGDPRDNQQRIAIELLSHIRNKSAGPTLLNFAASDAEPDLRLRAMIAAGATADPALIARLEEFVFRDGAGETDPVSVAAVWALANLESRTARPALLRLVAERAPTIQAIAVLGLSRLGERKDAALFASIVSSSEHGMVARAAAALALAELGDGRENAGILALADASDEVVRATAAVSLARLEAPGAGQAIAALLVSPSSELWSAGARAACVLGSSGPRQARRHLPTPEGRVDARTLLEQSLPNDCTPNAEAAALVLLAPEIAAAASRAVQSSPDEARALSLSLLGADGSAAFQPLTQKLDRADPELAARAREAIELIALAVVDPFVRLAEHPAAEVRQSALRWLAARREPAARSAVLGATRDADANVQRAALTALGARPDAAAASAVAEVLRHSSSWSLRRQAAQSLAQMALPGRDDEVLRALEKAATEDEYALVREAAARALFAIHPRAAVRVLERLRDSDPEAQVQAAARELLALQGAPAADRAREPRSDDPTSPP